MPDGRGDIRGARAARDERRATIDHRVPDLAMRVIAVVVRTDEAALEARDRPMQWLSSLRMHTDAGSRFSSVVADPRCFQRSKLKRVGSLEISVHVMTLRGRMAIAPRVRYTAGGVTPYSGNL